MESKHFIFDGKKSTEMGLYIVGIGQRDFRETPFISGLNIEEERIPRRHTPYFYGVEREPIEFTVQFMLMDKFGNPKKWTPQERYKIGQWLIHDTYKEFQTSDDLGKRYYAIVSNPANLFLINTEGYVEITFRTNSPFAWSPVYISEFDLSSNTGKTVKQFENKSNIITRYRPKIEIQMMGDTEVTLKNLSDGGKKFKFTGLKDNETVSVDNGNEIVLSDRSANINPFANFNRGWLELVPGENNIEIEGRCKIWLKTQFPIVQ